jgi:hypothetical protein
MLKEKVLGMCSKLLKAAQDKLAALEKNVLGYPNVII